MKSCKAHSKWDRSAPEIQISASSYCSNKSIILNQLSLHDHIPNKLFQIKTIFIFIAPIHQISFIQFLVIIYKRKIVSWWISCTRLRFKPLPSSILSPTGRPRTSSSVLSTAFRASPSSTSTPSTNSSTSASLRSSPPK